MEDVKLKLSSFFAIKNTHQLPDNYEFLSVLGEGSFGKVLKCQDKKKKRKVAIKIPKSDISNFEETLLKKFRWNSLDKCNIVEFLDSFKTQFGTAIVFELLDISLQDYLVKTQCTPMLLSDIRSISQQVATAFDALKRIGLIHCDVKLDNIMLADHQRRPLQVKLIDFGLSLPTRVVSVGRTLQTVMFRSPEIILGLPFSEAIDMWSLGCVMATIIAGKLPFPAEDVFQAMRFIVQLLGQPADHLLDGGKYTVCHFNRTQSNGWTLKEPQEYGHSYPRILERHNTFPPLDYLKKIRQEMENNTEAEEREQCIELLKAMLEMDPSKRITPSEVLTHPFINHEFRAIQDHKSSNFQTHIKEEPRNLVLESISDFSDCEPPATALDVDLNIQPVHSSPSPTIISSEVIKVRPATAENTVQLDCDLEREISLQTHINVTSGSSVMESKNEDFDCEPPATVRKDEITNIQLEHRSPTLTNQSSGVISVRPITAENTLHMDNQESAVSLQAGLNETSESLVEDTENKETASISEDANTCEVSGTQQKKRNKKKKNIIQRFFSWVRKKVCPCRVSPDVDGGGGNL